MSTELLDLIEYWESTVFVSYHDKDGTKSFQEKRFAESLLNYGFLEWPAKSNKKSIQEDLRKWIEDDMPVTGPIPSLSYMPPRSYIIQPMGTQRYPDVIVRDSDGRFIPIELKFSKNSQTPMWNEGFPHPLNVIYILGIPTETTFFLGSGVMNNNLNQVLKEGNGQLETVITDFNRNVENADKFKRGFKQKKRQQIFQTGEEANYFTHPDRNWCEENVKRFVSGQKLIGRADE